MRAYRNLEAILALPGARAERRGLADHGGRVAHAKTGASVHGDAQPAADELADLDRQTEVIDQQRLQTFRRFGTRDDARAAQLCVIRDDVPTGRRLAEQPDERTEVVGERVVCGARVTRGRVGIRPRPVEQGDQAVLEQVDEVADDRVVVVAASLERVFGQVKGQGPVRAKYAEGQLLETQLAARSRADGGDVAGSEPEMRRLLEHHGFVGRPACGPEPRPVRLRPLQQAESREQAEPVRIAPQRLERCYSVGRVPVRTGHRLTSPRSADSRRVSTNELSDT